MHWMITGVNPDWDDMGSRIGAGRFPKGPVDFKEVIRATPIEARLTIVAEFAKLPIFRFEFELFDDDNGLCFRGVAGDLDEAYGDAAFAPLNWAANDVGATYMMYRLKGSNDEWKYL